MRQADLETVCRVLAGSDREHSKVIMFLGAGCSISSGLPSASSLVASWVRRLGTEKCQDELPGFNPDSAGAHYSELFDLLCDTAQKRFSEMYRIMEGARPGFAYGALAKLIEKDHGRLDGRQRRLPCILTTNFDDLLEQALAIHTSIRALMVPTQNTIHLSSNCFSIVKLHGDYRHYTMNRRHELSRIHEDFTMHLGPLLKDSTLIFVGYAGRDQGVSQMVSEIVDKNFRPSCVYWVNKENPGEELNQALSRIDCFHVKHSDFDEMMLKVSLIANINPASLHRFSEYCEDYISYLEIIVKSNKMKSKFDIVSQLKFGDWSHYSMSAWDVLPNEINNASILFKNGIEKYPSSAALLSRYGHFLKDAMGDIDQAHKMYIKALEIDDRHWRTLGHLGALVKDHGQALGYANPYREALQHLKAVLSINPKDINSKINMIGLLIALGMADDACEIINECILLPMAEANRMEVLFYQFLSGRYSRIEHEISSEMGRLLQSDCRSLNYDFQAIAACAVARNRPLAEEWAKRMSTPILDPIR